MSKVTNELYINVKWLIKGKRMQNGPFLFSSVDTITKSVYRILKRSFSLPSPPLFRITQNQKQTYYFSLLVLRMEYGIWLY